MLTKLYAGIGSRRTPEPMLSLMQNLATWLAELGYVLRSGAADGADSAFYEGCTLAQVKEGDPKAEVWLPWEGFNDFKGKGCYPSETHYALAEEVHPAWERLTRGPRALHARNVGQVLGSDVNTPVSFVVCWTPDGCVDDASRTRDTGGTATAIVLASRRGIPVFNLAREGELDRFVQFVLAECRPFHPEGSAPASDEVFVFGSNLAGRHGAGAAAFARDNCGAIRGQGEGRMGACYAIPTKDGRNNQDLKLPEATRSLSEIAAAVDRFIEYAQANPETKFKVTRLGCVLAGHENKDIAPLFAKAPGNCSFPDTWKPWLGPMRTADAKLEEGDSMTSPGINIWSGAKGLGGALTNMSERAKEKGNIKHSYPVVVNGVLFEDSEAAYQAMKRKDDAHFNDGLMIDLIALKFKQHPKLQELVTQHGGVSWLGRCSHFTNATSPGFQSWEGQGASSRFIRNLMHGYQKSLLVAMAEGREWSLPEPAQKCLF